MHSSIKRLKRGLVAAVALACLTFGLTAHPAHAQAGYYTYTLNNVVFSSAGSGTVSGYFEYDPTTGQLGTFDITTSAGTEYDRTNSDDVPVSGMTYSSADGDLSENYDGGDQVFVFIDGNNEYGLAFNSALTSASTTAIEEDSEGTGIGTPPQELTNGDDPYREGFSGTVTASAVPELSPLSTIAFLSVLGCAALGVAGVKRRRTGSATI